MAYRPEWWPQEGNGQLCDLAMHIHCAVSGSSDDATVESLEPIAKALRWALENWTPTTIGRLAEFDNAVRAMVAAAVNEYERWKQAGTRFY